MLIKLSVCSKTISIYATTHASGNVVGEQRYYPFGETRWSTGSMFTDKLFTGQREMAGLGIYHYQARFYSPYINRFLSADTIVPGYANPQNLNRYSYVRNNPLRYIDPTGHMDALPADGGLCNTFTTLCNNIPLGGGGGSNGGGRNNNGGGDNGDAGCTSLACMAGNSNLFSGTYSPVFPATLTQPEFMFTDYSTTQDWYLAGYDYQINWSQVDWYHLITNGSGIVGDAAASLAIIGILPAAPVAGITQFVDVIGVTTDVLDFVSEGDFSGVSLDVAGHVLKETKAGRVIPIVGFGLNVDGFMDALYRGSTKTPIWKRKPKLPR